MRKIFFLFLIFTTHSCSSLIFTPVSLFERDSGFDSVYAGTKMNYHIVFGEHHPHGPFSGGRMIPFAVIDFPLSFVLDFVFLPITLPVGVVRKVTKKEEVELN